MSNSLGALLFLLAVLPVKANPIEATFVGVNGVAAFGFYVGPYYGTLEGQSVVFNCVDFANEVSFGQQWAANLSHINSSSDLADTRYGGVANAAQLYQQAAWLTLQYSLNPSSAYGDIQATIWQLFDPYAPTPSSGYWRNLAQQNYSSVNYDNFFVVTNIGPVNQTGQVQELLTVLNPSMSIYPQFSPSGAGGTKGVLATPEPRLMCVLGLFLIGVAEVVRRLRRPPP